MNNNDHHETATNWVLCGRFGSAFGDYPAMGAVVSHEARLHRQPPPYIAIPANPSFTWELGKDAFLGGRYESFKTGDPNAADFKVQDVSPFETLSPQSRQTAARRRCKRWTVWRKQIENNDQVDTYDEFHQLAPRRMILSSGSPRRVSPSTGKPDRLRDRYGRTTFGQSVLLARRLIEARRAVSSRSITAAGIITRKSR